MFFIRHSSTLFYTANLYWINYSCSLDLNSVFIRYQRFKNSRPVDESSGDVPLLPEEPVPTGLLVRYMSHLDMTHNDK